MDRYMNAPLDREEVKTLRAGRLCLYYRNYLYSQGCGHLRMSQTLDRGEELPIKLEGNVIYYMGPTPARPGEELSAPPVLLPPSRMDKYHSETLDLGLTGMIGKGKEKTGGHRGYCAERRCIFRRCRRRGERFFPSVLRKPKSLPTKIWEQKLSGNWR